MYTRYYDSYPAVPPAKVMPGEEKLAETMATETSRIAEIPENIKIENINPQSQITSKNSLFNSVQADDIILVALLFLLLSESDDVIMLIIIGFLLIGDKLPFWKTKKAFSNWESLLNLN